MIPLSRLKERAFRLALAASLFLILIGSRAALIGFASSPAPYMDEWDGDWGGLIRPYLDGSLTLDGLAQPFMEHRILFTRILVLLLFNLSGYWDVVAQMIVNAILGSAVIVGAAFALSRVTSGAWALAAIIAPCLLNIVPFAFDNILLGFNTHYYLLPALSLGALWLAADSPAWSPRWAAAAICGAASFFALASGALSLAAIAATHGVQMACGRRKGLREGLGVAALCGATALLIHFVPRLPESEAYRARSLGEFLSAVGVLLQWPAGSLFGWVLILPSTLYCVKIVADRPDLKDPRWFNLAALAWIVVQIGALAYGRAQAIPQSRYFDTLILAVTIHFVSALWMAETNALGARGTRAAFIALAAWVAILGVTLPRAERHLPREIEHWRETVEAGGEIVRFYLATGDASYLSSRPGAPIPYSDAGRLRAYLDGPEARAFLPPELLSQAPRQSGIEAAKRGFLGFAPVGVGCGAGTLLVALFWRWSMQYGAHPPNEPALAHGFKEALVAPDAVADPVVQPALDHMSGRAPTTSLRPVPLPRFSGEDG